MSGGLRGRARRAVRNGIALVLHEGWKRAAWAGAVTADRRAARRFGRFGQGSVLLFPPGVVYNEHYIHVGDDTVFGPNVVLAVGMAPGQTMLTDPVLVVGDRCRIGRGSEIVAHLSVVIEDDVYTGPNVYITDQNHDYRDTTKPIGLQSMPERPVRIGAGSWLGQRCTILPGVSVGQHSVVAAGAVVTADVPAYSVVAGVPARVVGSAGPGAESGAGSAAPLGPEQVADLSEQQGLV